jgi:hypothetical protein
MMLAMFVSQNEAQTVFAHPFSNSRCAIDRDNEEISLL